MNKFETDQNKKAGPVPAAGSPLVVLGELDPVRARTLLARFDLEAHSLTTGKRIEVDARVKPGPVEEILLPVFGRDEAESAVRDQLLYGPCRHRTTPLLESMSRTHGSFREVPTAANIPDYRRQHNLTTGSNGQQRDSDEGRKCTGKLEHGPSPFA